MKLPSIVIYVCLSLITCAAQAQDSTYYRRFFNRAGYSFSNLEAKDSQNRKANASATDLAIHGGLQMKMSALWSSQAELSLRQQAFNDGLSSTSYLFAGNFDLRRRILPRFDAALLAGLKQENFLYGDGNNHLAAKKISLPMLGIQTYTDLFRFITSGISLKLAYLRYFEAGSDEVTVKSGSAYRIGLVYLLRYREIDWSLELLHEKTKYDGNYTQTNELNSINVGFAYE